MTSQGTENALLKKMPLPRDDNNKGEKQPQDIVYNIWNYHNFL